jgi:hypothetical protein
LLTEAIAIALPQSTVFCWLFDCLEPFAARAFPTRGRRVARAATDIDEGRTTIGVFKAAKRLRKNVCGDDTSHAFESPLHRILSWKCALTATVAPHVGEMEFEVHERTAPNASVALRSPCPFRPRTRMKR